MNVFIVCLNAVLPSFLMMALGYFIRCLGLIDDKDIAKINKIVFVTAMPAMLFYNIYSSDFSAAVRPALLAYAVIAVFAAFFLSVIFVKATIKDVNEQSVVIQALFRSNFVIIGMSVAGELVPGATLASVAVLIAIVVPIFNMLGVVCLEVFTPHRSKIRSVILDILKNPLVVASALGLLFSKFGWRLPGILDRTVESIGDACTPIALFLLGSFFHFESVKRHIKYIAIVSLGRLVVIPGIFLTIGALLGFRGIEFAGLIGIFASATATSSFTMAQQMGGDSELAGDLVIATSVLCSFTLYLWSLLFMSTGIL